MTDTEFLDLIERYNLSVSPQIGGGWVIVTSSKDEDPEEIELARTRCSLRGTMWLAIQNLAKEGLKK